MNKKLISLISSAVLMVSAMPMTSMMASAANVQGLFDTYDLEQEYISMCPVLKKNESFFDVTGDQKLDFNDYKLIQRTINRLYANNNFNFDQKINTNSQGNVTIDDKNVSADKLDVNKDGEISVEDYCLLLRYIQKNYEISVHEGECYAIINKYLKHPSETNPVTSLIVPTEVYYRGKILPVMSIQKNAFSNVPELESIYFADYKHPQWVDNYGNRLDENEIADNVTASIYLTIHDNAFEGCEKLTKIYLPDHVILENNAFLNSKLTDHFSTEENGIKYFNSDNNKKIAFSVEGNAVDGNGTLKFAKGTTSINPDLFCSNSSIRNVELSDTVKFIGNNAFYECSNLSTVNGDTYADLDVDEQNLVRAYICSFKGTNLLTTATEEKITEIANSVRRTTDVETVNALGRYIFGNVYYNGFDSYGGENINYNNGLADPFKFNKDGLYVTTWYNSKNYCRESIYAASSAFLLDATECEGFSYATALVLDKLGIPNYSVGPYIEPKKEEKKENNENSDKKEGSGVAYGHAYNIVYVDGEWYELDLSADGDREYELLNGEPRFESKSAYLIYLKSYNFLRPLKKAAIAGRSEFAYYSSSKDRQFSSGSCNFSLTSDSKILLIEENSSKLSNSQLKTLRDGIAAGIIKFKSTLEPGFNWLPVKGEWRCYDQNGILQVCEWIPNEDGDEYYVDREGKIVYGQWVSRSNNVYGYVNGAGIRVKELIMIDNKVYLNGELQTEPFNFCGVDFNVDSEGRLIND